MTTADRRLLSGTAYAGMFVFGIVMALLGAVLPALSGRLEFQVEDIGTLFLAMNLAMLVSSSFLGAALDRFGMKPPLAIGPLLVAAALAAIADAARISHLIPAVVLLGTGGAALNAATNTLVADLDEDPRRKAAALNILGVFFGVGALCLPFCAGALLGTLGIHRLLLAASALCALAGLFAASLHYPAPKQKHRLPVAEIPRFLRSPLVRVMGCLLFLESGVEFTMGGYISTYLTRWFGMGVAAASWLLAAYWAAIMTARLVWSRVLARVNPRSVVIACAAVASAAAALASVAPGPASAAAGICLAGFALSAIFPTALGIAGAAFRDHSGTVFGILFTAALTGGTLLPWVAGRLAGFAGLAWVFGLAAAAFALISVLGVALGRVTR
jgi:fucose permease